jgi:hypothetical protein
LYSLTTTIGNVKGKVLYIPAISIQSYIENVTSRIIIKGVCKIAKVAAGEGN